MPKRYKCSEHYPGEAIATFYVKTWEEAMYWYTNTLRFCPGILASVQVENA